MADLPGAPYPEHDKLKAAKGNNQVIGDFLTHLRRKGLHVCKWSDADEGYYPLQQGTAQLLADYFGIDLLELDLEKERMLAELQKVIPRG